MDAETFRAQSQKLRNDYGDPVEEFEIQFIDGDELDCAFANAFGLNQANYAAYLQYVEDGEDWQKIHFILAVGECGYSFNADTVSPDDFDVEIYDLESLKVLAEQFVEDGVYGEIPDPLRFYIDNEAMACDLAFDYTVENIAGGSFVYRCG